MPGGSAGSPAPFSVKFRTLPHAKAASGMPPPLTRSRPLARSQPSSRSSSGLGMFAARFSVSHACACAAATMPAALVYGSCGAGAVAMEPAATVTTRAPSAVSSFVEAAVPDISALCVRSAKVSGPLGTVKCTAVWMTLSYATLWIKLFLFSKDSARYNGRKSAQVLLGSLGPTSPRQRCATDREARAASGARRRRVLHRSRGASLLSPALCPAFLGLALAATA